MDQRPGAFAHSDEMTWIAPLIRGVFEVQDVTVGAMDGMATRLRGRFLTSTEHAYRTLAPHFDERGRTLMFRREEERDVILSLSWVNRPKPNNRWLPVLLAMLTIVSVIVTYLLMYGGMTEFSWEAAQAGLGEAAQFAVALVGILLAHEMGHYVVARRQGLAVTPPYLIPFPLSPFGTMGAVIRMKGIPVNKRAMLLTGAAGPIAGLIVALPVVIAGLALSEVRPLPDAGTYLIEGNSLLYLLLKYLIHGEWLPTATHDVFMHPLAFAGWAGLLVTAFNLIPAGQLDGGHVAYALLGTRARYLTWAIIIALAALGLVWPGWLLWAGLVFFFSRTQQEPLDAITPLKTREIVIAAGLLIALVLTFTPLPLRLVN